MKRDYVGCVSKCWLDVLVCWFLCGLYMVYVYRICFMCIFLLGGFVILRFFIIFIVVLLVSSIYYINLCCVVY